MLHRTSNGTYYKEGSKQRLYFKRSQLFLIKRLVNQHIYIYITFSLISVIADVPHHYHPACGHKGSGHLSPVHALQRFIAMQVQHSYNSSTNG